MNLSRPEILSLLMEGNPISIVRYGDGESIVLNATATWAALDKASNAVIKRQTGYCPTVDEVKAIRSNLIDCYTHADVIGVPMHTHAVNADWTAAAGILKANVPAHTNKICNIDVAYQMLDDNSYGTLLQNRRVLNYISCRYLDEGFHNRYNVGIVNRFIIAPEMKFTSGYSGDVHYPTQFNRVPRWLDVMAERHPGSLLFVGAGVIGKIYCNWWRDRGGVAMDIGGVMDLFAGRVTRGPERGLDKEDNRYKL